MEASCLRGGAALSNVNKELHLYHSNRMYHIDPHHHIQIDSIYHGRIAGFAGNFSYHCSSREIYCTTVYYIRWMITMMIIITKMMMMIIVMMMMMIMMMKSSYP